MSSTNKTENLKLNSWIGSDVPQREDFNRDNQIIDDAITQHISDDDIHIAPHEREQWNAPYYMITYYGNGASTRTIDHNAPFTPSWGIVFAVNMPLSIVDINNEANYNYFTVFTNRGSSIGVSLSGLNSLQLTQSSTPVRASEFRNFNEYGVTYVAILFR